MSVLFIDLLTINVCCNVQDKPKFHRGIEKKSLIVVFLCKYDIISMINHGEVYVYDR